MSGTSESQFRSITHEAGCNREIARVIDGVLHVDDLRQGCRTWVPLRGWVEVDKLALLLKGLQTGQLNIDQILSGLAVKTFQSGVLDAVRACGGQFEAARVTTVPGGEVLKSQRDNKVIKFWNDWFFQKMKPEQKLSVAPSIGSEVIYLPNVIEGSLGCTYDQVEGKQNVEDVLDSLPKVEGLRWIIGNTPSVNRVLANHLQETDGQEYLLQGVWTWTTDTYESPDYGLERLLAGGFDGNGVDVDDLVSFGSSGFVGVFVLGVPA